MRRRGAGARGPIRRAALAGAVVLAAVSPAPAAAQQVIVELLGGAAIGNYTDTDAGLDVVPGPAFGVLLELRPTETLAGYAGFTRSSFGCEEGFCSGRDVSMTSQGIVLGGRWAPGIPWVRAGLAFQGLTLRAEGPDSRFDPGPGFEVAAGVEVPLWRQIRVRPGVTWLRHDASTELGGGHVSLLAFQVGVAMGVAAF